MDANPNGPVDPNTTTYCTWWIDYNGETCDNILSQNWITIDDFRRWNPSIGTNCEGLITGNSYCVEALFEPPPPKTSTSSSKVSSTPPPTSKATSSPKPTSTPSTTSKPTVPSTTTKPGNGIQTPLPTQPNMIDNCDEFYFVKEGDGCASIASQFGITLEKFLKWNPSAGSTCGGLWKDAYACVSIIGEVGSSVPPPAPSTTKPGNGIATPQPTQPNMVSNCDKFHYVETGKDNCQSIATKYGITLDQFLNWNPSAGNTCGGLWGDAYCCVSIIGHEPTPTNPGGGVTTPTPFQPGMVNNCKKFYLVQKGEGCDTVTKKNNVSLANFVKWNPGVGSDCRNMWAEAYVCVGI
ncbi:hypothetical protein CC78DRAFT_470029 [Lojkania enalia]|uniref:LysM domain-containing protein n=1 Tax=Lojkania enalia TaxID=147567 RepID=A0A9P4K3R2_9PLEO|nr:hypothetical protein CC78DRAFT_470029 [Didymosphaeria enalia]